MINYGDPSQPKPETQLSLYLVLLFKLSCNKLVFKLTFLLKLSFYTTVIITVYMKENGKNLAFICYLSFPSIS
jgi:hypothetical protein